MNVFDRAPPFGLVRNWLGPDTVRGLLAYAEARQDAFVGSVIRRDGGPVVDPAFRASLQLRDLGDFAAPLRRNIVAQLPAMAAQLGVKPFVPARVWIELIAHNDGAFFKRHTDASMSAPDGKSRRVISAVYYFHAEPKAFSGGVLRLYPLSASSAPGPAVDIAPDNDSLVYFLSWFPHEVTPVECPSRRFADSRFAINFWIHAAG